MIKEREVTEFKANNVQAFISTIAFPFDLEWVKYFVDNKYPFDVEGLISASSACWSVPKWARRWDIMLFMHTKTSIDTINSLRSKLKKNKANYDDQTYASLITAIDHGEELYREYGGKIYAIGMVQGNILDKEPGDTRYYAPINRIIELENPLDYDEFKDMVNVSQSIIPVYGDKFQKIKELLSRNNELPRYVQRAESLPIREHKINRYNWIRVQRKFKFRFILESQFRNGFVDYLLKEIGDTRKIYEECATHQNGKPTGYVDNVIRFGGQYLPVEVKLNIKAEKNLTGQVEKYCNLSKLILDSKKKEEADIQKVISDHVLIIDTYGLYMYQDDIKEISKIYSLAQLKSMDDISVIKAIIAENLGFRIPEEERKKCRIYDERISKRLNKTEEEKRFEVNRFSGGNLDPYVSYDLEERERYLVNNPDIEEVYNIIDEMDERDTLL